MSKFANRSPRGTSQRTAYGISTGTVLASGGATPPGTPPPSGGLPALPNPSGAAPIAVSAMRSGAGGICASAGQPERGVAEADAVPLGQRRVGDPLLVDEGAVVAAQIYDAVPARRRAQL